MQAIGVLIRIDRLENSIGIDATRKWQLNDETRASGISIQLFDCRKDFLLRSLGRQIDANRFNTYFCAVTVFTRHVSDRTGILPDQDGTKAWDYSLFAQGLNSASKLIFDLSRTRRTIQNASIAFPRSSHWLSPAYRG